MNRQELHELLTVTLGLIPEHTSNNISQTYFHKVIEWHPLRSTRVFRVLFESNGEPARIQLCSSSDNNNTVLIVQPFCKQALIEAASIETELIEARLQALPQIQG